MTLNAFIAGLILLLVSILAYGATRDKIHPGVVFPFVWAATLVIGSFLPLMDFYPIEGNALLIFLAGGIFFSLTSVVMHYLLKRQVYPPRPISSPSLNSNYLVIFLFFTNSIVFYFAINDFMALGPDISRAAYMARHLSVQGEQVCSPIVSNYMLFGLVSIPILTALLIKAKLNLAPYLIITLPWMTLILLFNGRAGLIRLLLALFFIYYLLVREVSLKSILFGCGAFVLIMLAGALAVNKSGIGSADTFADIVVVFVRHVASYTFQGPILFAQYFDGQAVVSPNWSPFRSIQHILSLFGLSPPPPFLHLEFNQYGGEIDMVGNVYSLYFSFYPNNGLSGSFIILIGYSVASTYIYMRAKSGELVYVLLSCYLFSAMVLSIYSDTFLPKFWFFIKLVVIVAILKFFMRSSTCSMLNK
jgi:oligosaccharide repeat unit polymerase